MQPASYLGVVLFNYRLTKKLGRGGFGDVYLAEHVDLGRRAACKILHSQFAHNHDLVERFFREAKAVCAIGHPAIIDVQNFGRLPSGEPFYLMDYFPGENLAQYSARVGPIPLTQIPIIFDPIANALAAAHAKGIIHRDLKPDNVMLLETNGHIADVKLVDFGIAKLMDEQVASHTQTGIGMGTPRFMAPEQARDAKHADARSDIYSFAATIYTAIAGQPPFTQENITDLVIAVQTQPATPLRQVAPHAPPMLEQVMSQCMDKAPGTRPASIEEAWSRIRETLGGYPRMGSAPMPAQRISAPMPAQRISAQMPAQRISAPMPAQRISAPMPAQRVSEHMQAQRVSEHMQAQRVSAHMQAQPPPLPAFPAADSTLGMAGSEMQRQRSSDGLQWPWIAAAAIGLVGVGIVAVLAVKTIAADDSTRQIAVLAHDDADGMQPTTADIAAADLPDAATSPPVDASLDAPVQQDELTDDEALDCTESSFTDLYESKLSRAERRQVIERLDACLGAGEISEEFHEQARSRLSSSRRSLVCSTGSFERVYKQAAPSDKDIKSALARLKRCRKHKAIDAATYERLQKALIYKL